MDRVYYHFPERVDLERHYGYNGDMKYLVKVMSSMYGKGGKMEFDTSGPNVKRNPDEVKARRDMVVDVAENRLDFLPLDQRNTSQVLPTIPAKGTIDFRVTVRYTYFDKNFDKMSLIDDVFLVRAILSDELTLKVAKTHGQGRTGSEEVVDTIETMMEHYKE